MYVCRSFPLDFLVLSLIRVIFWFCLFVVVIILVFFCCITLCFDSMVVAALVITCSDNFRTSFFSREGLAPHKRTRIRSDCSESYTFP